MMLLADQAWQKRDAPLEVRSFFAPQVAPPASATRAKSCSDHASSTTSGGSLLTCCSALIAWAWRVGDLKAVYSNCTASRAR